MVRSDLPNHLPPLQESPSSLSITVPEDEATRPVLFFWKVDTTHNKYSGDEQAISPPWKGEPFVSACGSQRQEPTSPLPIVRGLVLPCSLAESQACEFMVSSCSNSFVRIKDRHVPLSSHDPSLVRLSHTLHTMGYPLLAPVSVPLENTTTTPGDVRSSTLTYGDVHAQWDEMIALVDKDRVGTAGPRPICSMWTSTELLDRLLFPHISRWKQMIIWTRSLLSEVLLQFRFFPRWEQWCARRTEIADSTLPSPFRVYPQKDRTRSIKEEAERLETLWRYVRAKWTGPWSCWEKYIRLSELVRWSRQGSFPVGSGHRSMHTRWHRAWGRLSVLNRFRFLLYFAFLGCKRSFDVLWRNRWSRSTTQEGGANAKDKKENGLLQKQEMGKRPPVFTSSSLLDAHFLQPMTQYLPQWRKVWREEEVEYGALCIHSVYTSAWEQHRKEREEQHKKEVEKKMKTRREREKTPFQRSCTTKRVAGFVEDSFPTHEPTRTKRLLPPRDRPLRITIPKTDTQKKHSSDPVFLSPNIVVVLCEPWPVKEMLRAFQKIEKWTPEKVHMRLRELESI